MSPFDAGLILYSLSSVIYTCVVLWGNHISRPPDVCEDDGGHIRGVGLVIPAFNAGLSAGCMRETLAESRAAGLDAAVVDDGSAEPLDMTSLAARACGGLKLVRHHCNRGKAAALGTGIAALTADVIVTVDADTIVRERDFRLALNSFADRGVGALSLSLSVAPGGIIHWVQALEYRCILDFERRALAALGMVVTVPGAASLWRRAALQQIGGFSARTMSEDTDATIGLRCAGWRIAVQPDAGAVTEAPGDWGRLLRQRKRWIWGNVQVAVRQLLDTIGADRVGWPAIQFATMTAWHLGAYLLASWGVVAIALGQYSPTAQVTTTFLLLLSAPRLYIALVVQGDSARSLPRAMLSSFVMQVVNVLAFWTGLATGSAWRHRWT